MPLKPISPTMSLADWLLLLLLGGFWGATFIFVELSVDVIPPMALVAYRVGFAAIILNVWLVLIGRPLPFNWRAWKAFLTMGLLNNVIPFYLLFWGQQTVNPSLTSILVATTPLFAITLAHFLTGDEKFTPGRLTGVLVGFAGAVTVIGPSALLELDRLFLAQLALLGVALFYSLAGIYGRRFRDREVSAIQAATGQLTGATVIVVPLAFFVGGYPAVSSLTPAVVLSVAAIVVLSTVFGYLIYFRILSNSGATNILLVTFLVPVSAIFLGFTFLGDSLNGRQVAGMALIAIGLLAIDGRLWRLVRGR